MYFLFAPEWMEHTKTPDKYFMGPLCKLAVRKLLNGHMNGHNYTSSSIETSRRLLMYHYLFWVYLQNEPFTRIGARI